MRQDSGVGTEDARMAVYCTAYAYEITAQSGQLKSQNSQAWVTILLRRRTTQGYYYN